MDFALFDSRGNWLAGAELNPPESIHHALIFAQGNRPPRDGPVEDTPPRPEAPPQFNPQPGDPPPPPRANGSGETGPRRHHKPDPRRACAGPCPISPRASCGPSSRPPTGSWCACRPSRWRWMARSPSSAQRPRSHQPAAVQPEAVDFSGAGNCRLLDSFLDSPGPQPDEIDHAHDARHRVNRRGPLRCAALRFTPRRTRSVKQRDQPMAARLKDYVTGQKRFLGDAAHELCSPLARMEIALEILEHRSDAQALPPGTRCPR